MPLAEKLDAIREASAKRTSIDNRPMMGRAITDLRWSEILDDVPKVGDPLPDFSPKNAQGVELHQPDLLSQSAVVLTIFRGVW